MSNAIRTENLSKHFLRARALSSLNLEVPQGAIYALVGPNGAGKTTAIKVMMNILAPSAGRAEVLGLDSKKLAGRHFAEIGYVSENQQIPEWMPVGYFLRFLRDFYPTWDSELEASLVRHFDLPLDRKLRHLSRGMKMKAALAGSLAYRPRLIVMDEPFTGLDPLVRDQLIESLLERATEATVLISSHDLAEIENFASHVGYLDHGRLRFSEEMTTLSQRFREVQVSLSDATAAKATPASVPASWMELKSSGSVVQFIESAFDQERTRASVLAAFGQARDVTFTPMTLREIFLACARKK